MDWSNERYVRVYVRDTGDLLSVGWEGRLVWYEFLRHCDRSGVIDIDLDALPELLRIPHDICLRGVERLIARGCVTKRDSALIAKNFIEAQEAHQSDRLRQAESRAKRRSRILEGDVSRNVTLASRNVTESHDLSQRVTSGHSASQVVTPSLAVPNLANKNIVEFGKLDATRQKAKTLASEAVAYLNAKIGSKYSCEAKALQDNFRALAADGVTTEQVRAVVDAKISQWRGDEKMRHYLRATTLFRPSNFRRYMAEADGAPGPSRITDIRLPAILTIGGEPI